MMFQPFDSYQPKTLPRTVEEVVDLLYKDLLVRDRIIMAGLSEEELASSVYLALAKSIRQEFGLYTGNQHLIDSCRSYMVKEYVRFEDPVMIIAKELWKKVQRTHFLRLVKS